jgi:transcription initiation factor TFIIF subunit alpha
MDSDEDEDEEEQKGLTETGKVIKKALLKLEKNRVYASDDDKDPYASVRKDYSLQCVYMGSS